MSKQLTPRLNRLEPNIVIDGGMEIWPEGTSRSVINNSSAYGAVLFKLVNSSSSVTLTNSQQSSIPSNTDLSFSNQISKTAAGTLAAGTEINMFYYIEGYDTQKLIKNEFSLIFWVKSSVVSNRSFALRNTGGTHSFVQQYSVDSVNTWELKVLKFPALSTCPGTIDRTSNIGLFCNWSVITGTNKQTSTLNTWQVGNFLAGLGEDTTWLTGTTHDFNIAGVMILPGDWTALETNTSMYNFLRAGRDISDEWNKVNRYWQSTYDGMGVIPRANVGNGTGEIQVRWGTAPSSSDELYAAMPLKAQMRALPTVELWSPAGVQNQFTRDGGGTITAQLWNAGRNFHQIVATNGAVSNTAVHRIHIIADARF